MAKSKAKTKVAAPVVVVESTTAKNRARRLAKHLKQHPNDVQTQNAPKEGTPRAKPKASNSTRQAYKLLTYVENYGHKMVAFQLARSGGAELFPRNGLKLKDYEKAVADKRRPMAEFLRTNQAKFGNVAKTPEDVAKENANIVLAVLGIKRSGKSRKR